MGGGRSRFLPESQGGEGSRKDNLSLIMDWETDKLNQGTARYVSSRADLLSADLNTTDYLLGRSLNMTSCRLFTNKHFV